MKKIIVIGGGAAGMFAAINAAADHTEVHIYEHNEKLGKKLFITGKGRCNVTNGCDDVQDLLRNVVTNERFLYSAFYSFNNKDMMALLETNGLPLKTERGQRVFPVSDKSSDVIAVLSKMLRQRNVHVHFREGIREILTEAGSVCGVLNEDGEEIRADAVILATGGISYASTGSTGDGHRMAASTGHRITDMRPSLVPMVCSEEWIRDLQGLSLKNINFTLKQGKKTIYEEFGEMMFTHFGVTGPVVLSGSTRIGRYLKKGEIKGIIDLKPSLTDEQLDARILRDFQKNINRQLRNSLSELLPNSLIPVIILLSGIDQYTVVHDITKEQRRKLVDLIKNLTFTVTGVRGFNEAIITQGGINVKDVNPSTMESKIISGLFMAGEVLDLDAVTGGFNLQIAWSTAYLAGRSAAGLLD